MTLRRGILWLSRPHNVRHLVVWLLAVAAAAALLLHQEQGLTVDGYGEEVSYAVAPRATGRLLAVVVRPNDSVQRGQLLAWFDDAELRLALQEARAELSRLQLELDRETVLWQLGVTTQTASQMSDQRRFARDLENARIEHLQLVARLAEDRTQLQGLEWKLTRTRELHASQLTSPALLEADSVACQARRVRITTSEAAVAAAAARVEDSRARYESFLDEGRAERPAAREIPSPLQAALDVQEVRIRRLELETAALKLQAPADGVVAALTHRAGDIVAAGEPVVILIEPAAEQLVAWIPEQQWRKIAPGQEVRVRRRNAARGSITARVASVGVRVESLPARLTRSGTPSTWGTTVRVALPPGVRGRPGEAFEISF